MLKERNWPAAVAHYRAGVSGYVSEEEEEEEEDANDANDDDVAMGEGEGEGAGDDETTTAAAAVSSVFGSPRVSMVCTRLMLCKALQLNNELAAAWREVRGAALHH